MSLASKVLIGLALGIALGVVFGESVAFVGAFGRAYLLLLQMAVLPYVAISLIAGLGGLSSHGWRSLVRYAGGFLLLSWAVTLAVVIAAPIAFPGWPSGTLFSATLVEERAELDFLDFYIPANPFRSLSEGAVPAVVVFSLAFGIALMDSDRKRTLLDTFLGAQDALRRMTSAVVHIAPYGIFAIAAEAAGSLDVARLAGLQVYLVTYIVLSLLLAFWVLPALVAAATPLSYREVFAAGRDALVTAFATGSLFIVLPIIADRARKLFEEREAGEEAERQVDVVVPIAFTLAGAGKLLGLLFVLYAGWQSGHPLSPVDYPALAGTGLFSSFAGSAVSLPFLLDLFRIPSDMFELFLVVDSVIGNRFSALVGSMHGIALALLAGCGAAAWIRFELRRFALWILISIVATAGALGVVRIGFQRFDSPFTGYRSFIQRSFLLPTTPWRDRDALPAEDPQSPGDALRRVRARGSLRVGYAADRLPYAFRNAPGELVGFDIEMAHALARDLGVRVEFFRVGDPKQFPALLNAGTIDVAMSGLTITPERLEQMNLSTPYLHETLAFVVRDHHRDRFRSGKSIRSIPSLELAVPERGYYAEKIREYLPEAQITLIDSPRAFFRAEEGTFDAMVFAAEVGSAWTLIYPEYTVAVPHPEVLRVPVGYASARDDRRMAEFIDAWILLKRNDRTIPRLFTYWFEGREPPGQERRWSLARDVFGWGALEAPESTELPPASESTAPASPGKPALESTAPAPQAKPALESTAPAPQVKPALESTAPKPRLKPTLESAAPTPQAEPKLGTPPQLPPTG